jgi:hypothetical protein
MLWPRRASRVLVVFLMLFQIRRLARSWQSPRHGTSGASSLELQPPAPPSLTALRVGIARRSPLFAETFARWGLGYFVVESWMRMAYPDLYAGVAVFGALGFVLTRLVDAAARRACRWQDLTSP